MNVKTQAEALHWASSFLKKLNRDEHVAKLLLFHHFNVNEHDYMMTLHDKVEGEVLTHFIRDVKEYGETGKPVQHILGQAYFYGRSFFVNENVLIPRFDTEFLVEHVISYVNKQKEPVTIVDVGTGSGIIAITLAKELKDVKIYATDISEAALEVARKNAQLHDVQVEFMQANYLSSMLEQKIYPNLIVSNPPYIELGAQEELSDTVKNFDPPLALYGGDTGLVAYEAIVDQLKGWPHPAHLALEIGYNQAQEVTNLLEKNLPCTETGVIQDFGGHDRVVYCSFKK
ncbi:MAG TPA: peptide chain release factor N(5)-glutamine methyltransferase [Pseudogracilibacillus sp.]|nr:peptide chain release factor N(5)-glutamine methyltransferase [Pseudogracilibacillus sp.]